MNRKKKKKKAAYISTPFFRHRKIQEYHPPFDVFTGADPAQMANLDGSAVFNGGSY